MTIFLRKIAQLTLHLSFHKPETVPPIRQKLPSMTAPAPQPPPQLTALSPPDDKLLLGQVRANGLQRPLTRDQLASWLGHALSAALFYGAVGVLLLASDEREHERGLGTLVRSNDSIECLYRNRC